VGKLGVEEYRSGKIWDWRNVGSEGEITEGIRDGSTVVR